MSTEDNKALFRRFMEEIWNKKNFSILEEVVAPDCPHYMNGTVNFKGPDGIKTALESWIAAFPNLKVSIDQVLAEGDIVAGRGTLRGKHEGPLQFAVMPAPIPATGKEVSIESSSFNKIEGGKIVEIWDTANYTWIQELIDS